MRPSFLRLWLLKEVLSLPSAVLRFFSGGGVVYEQERTLDTQVQFLWRSWFSAPRMPLTLTDKSLELARQEWQDMAARLSLPSRLKVKIVISGLISGPASAQPQSAAC
jgi:acetyl esterase